LTAEDAPNPEALAFIEAVEGALAVEGRQREAYLARLPAAAAARVRAALALSLVELATLYQITLPGIIHGYDDSRPPVAPTAARPGSPEKLAVMAERAARGESLFAEGDAR